MNTTQRLEADAEVFWKDGVSGERKIIYIPQSWLNRVVDESGGDTQLNAMIRGILLQQPSIYSSHRVLEGKITEIIASTKRNIEESELLSDKKKSINDALIELNTSFEPLKQIVAKNDQLMFIM